MKRVFLLGRNITCYSRTDSRVSTPGTVGPHLCSTPSKHMSQNDLLELNSLLKLAKGQYAKILLDAAIKDLSQTIEVGTSPTPSSEPAEAPVAPSPPPPVPYPPLPPAPAGKQTLTSPQFTPIDTFSFDAGEYNSPTLSVYVALPSVGNLPKGQVTCKFKATGFDLLVKGLEGKDHRLVQNNLEHEINVDKSRIIIKAEKVILKLGKIKGEYSYDTWTQLIASKKTKKKNNADPAAGLQELMKDMYDDGDDNMRKVLGEAMLKQRNGEKEEIPKYGDFAGGKSSWEGDEDVAEELTEFL